MKVLGVVTLAAVLVSGCAHAPQKKMGEVGDLLAEDLFQHVDIKEPVDLSLHGEAGQIERLQFSSSSVTESFENQALTSKREEGVDFVVTSVIKQILPGQKYRETVTTSDKDGISSLHDFALPEVGEELEFIYTPKAEILKANDFPPNSIYFVPPISLPKGPVAPGDTWTMESRWVTEQNVPLTLRLLTILKGFVNCGTPAELCADLELSGDVTIDSVPDKVVFGSQWRGRMLFATKRGSVIWSLIESHEAWTSEVSHRDVRSCLVSNMVEPSGFNFWGQGKPKCKVPEPDKTTASASGSCPRPLASLAAPSGRAKVASCDFSL